MRTLTFSLQTVFVALFVAACSPFDSPLDSNFRGLTAHGMNCRSDSQCNRGESCRSKVGGGTECRASQVAMACYTDRDCSYGESCRSAAGGGTECRPIAGGHSASTEMSSSRSSTSGSNRSSRSVDMSETNGIEQSCKRMGFVPGTSAYSDCQLRLEIATREAQQREAAFEAAQRQYELELRRYQEQVARYEKEKERQKSDAFVRFGSALLGGSSPHFSENFANAGRASLGLPPAAPVAPPIQNFNITGPSGRMTSCSVVGNNINCF